MNCNTYNVSDKNKVVAPSSSLLEDQPPNALPISIFRMEPNSSGDDTASTTWTQLLTASFTVQDHQSTLSLHLSFTSGLICSFSKETISQHEQTGFIAKGETFDGPVWLALRFFTNKDAQTFSGYLDKTSASEESDRKRSQMRRRMQFIVETELLEKSFESYFVKTGRRNHLKTFCEELAPFVSDCERPSYRS